VNGRTVLLAALGSLLATTTLPAAFGQVPASVKANASGDGKVLIQMQPGGRFVATNVTLHQGAGRDPRRRPRRAAEREPVKSH